MQEYADQEQCRRDSRNAACRSKFADSDVPPPHIAADPNLAYAWALDRSDGQVSSPPPRWGDDHVRQGMACHRDPPTTPPPMIAALSPSPRPRWPRTHCACHRRNQRGSSASVRRPLGSLATTPPPSAAQSPTMTTPTPDRAPMMEEEPPASPASFHEKATSRNSGSTQYYSSLSYVLAN